MVKQRYAGCEVDGVSVPPEGWCMLDKYAMNGYYIDDVGCTPCPFTTHCAQCYDGTHNCGTGAFCDQLTVADRLQQGDPGKWFNIILRFILSREILK